MKKALSVLGLVLIMSGCSDKPKIVITSASTPQEVMYAKIVELEDSGLSGEELDDKIAEMSKAYAQKILKENHKEEEY